MLAPIAHNSLSAELVPDALINGIRHSLKKANSFSRIIIRINPSINIEDPELNTALRAQDLTEIKRTHRLHDNTPTYFVKANIADTNTYNTILQKGVRIGWKNYKVEPDIPLKQCHNC